MTVTVTVTMTVKIMVRSVSLRDVKDFPGRILQHLMPCRKNFMILVGNSCTQNKWTLFKCFRIFSMCLLIQLIVDEANKYAWQQISLLSYFAAG